MIREHKLHIHTVAQAQHEVGYDVSVLALLLLDNHFFSDFSATILLKEVESVAFVLDFAVRIIGGRL